MASTGVNRDPIAEAQRALVFYLQSALPAQLLLSGYQNAAQLARIQDGWADVEQEILEPDGTSTPKNAVVTVTTPAGGEFMPHPPERLSTFTPDAGQPEIESLYRVGSVELTLQLDVWAKSRAEREAVAGALRLALRGAVPLSTTLSLELAGYFGVRAAFRVNSTGFHSDQGSLVGGAWWRYTLDVSAEFDEVVKTTAARLRELYLRKFIPYEATEPDPTERIF